MPVSCVVWLLLVSFFKTVYIVLHHELWLKVCLCVFIYTPLIGCYIPLLCRAKLAHGLLSGKYSIPATKVCSVHFAKCSFSISISVAADDLVLSSQKDDARDTAQTTLTDVSTSLFLYPSILVFVIGIGE